MKKVQQLEKTDKYRIKRNTFSIIIVPQLIVSEGCSGQGMNRI